MLYLVGFSVVSIALLGVHLAKRSVESGSAPAWLRWLVLGNAVALATTIALASGFGLLLQTALDQGGASGYALAGAGTLLPFLGLWWLIRRQVSPPPALEASDLPPTTGGRPRRARPGPRSAVASEGAAGIRRAG